MSNTMDQRARDELIRAFPLSDLGRRLLRRITRPVGMIDVGHAVSLHARASLGPMARLDFLAELRRRYGLEQDAAPGLASAGGMPLAASLSAGARGASELAASTRADAIAATAAAAVKSAADTPPASSAPRYRVKRPKSGHASDAAHAPLRTPITADDKRTGGQTESLQRGVDQTQLLAGSRSTPVLASHEPDVSPSAAELTLRVAGHAAMEQAASATASPNRAASPHDEPASRPDTIPVAAAMPLSVAPTPAPTSGRLAHAAEALASPPPMAHAPEALALRTSVAGAPHLQRADDPAPAPESLTRAARTISAAPPADIAPQSRVAVATPIATVPAAPTNIVWRKADGEAVSHASVLPSARTLSPSMNGVSSRQDGAPEQIFAGHAPAPAASPVPASAALDVTHIAQQVRRAIARQVRVERERRGRTR